MHLRKGDKESDTKHGWREAYESIGTCVGRHDIKRFQAQRWKGTMDEHGTLHHAISKCKWCLSARAMVACAMGVPSRERVRTIYDKGGEQFLQACVG